MITKMDPRAREKCEFVPQAIVDRPPAFFIAKGISFRIDMDDLNAYQVAELALDDKLPFALMRHEGTPPGQTEVYLPDTVPIQDIPHEIGRILSELDLPVAAIGWQRRPSGAV